MLHIGKNYSRYHALAFVFGALVVAEAATPAFAAGFKITASVSRFERQRGALVCRLYSDPKGFPGEPPYVAERRVPIKNTTELCMFSGMKPGVYAITAHYDEDNDGVLDTNLFGIPSEPVGCSNNPKPAMRAPTFSEAKFAVQADLTVKIVLR